VSRNSLAPPKMFPFGRLAKSKTVSTHNKRSSTVCARPTTSLHHQRR
jgi:hypothetical protein